jgi:hypothetical protein
VGIPSWMGFFRAQLVVVSCLFGGNPFVDGILGHNLLLSQAFSVGIPLWTGFKLSRSLSFFYNRTLAIRGPFSQTFLFLRWNSGYQEALRTNSSFFTMEFWLSRSLSHNFFSRRNSGYQEAFLTIFFFFHDGILAIRKPFSRIFSFFHDGILAIRKRFSRTFFFFHDEILAIRKPFSRTFFTMEFWKYAIGGRLFIYIYIYTRANLHLGCRVKFYTQQ